MTTIFVPAGQALTLTAISAGSYYLIGNPGDAPGAPITIAAAGSAIIGPFNNSREYAYLSNNDDMSSSLSVSGFMTAADDAVVTSGLALKQDTISTATLTAATVAVGDLVLIQDLSDSKNLKTVTTQAVANLADLSSRALTSATVIADLAAEADAPTIVTKVNALLAALRVAGITVAA